MSAAKELNPETFEAYVCEVASVNIGRLQMLRRNYKHPEIDRIIQSLLDMKCAAKLGAYPAEI